MDDWGELEILLEHLDNGTLRIMIRDCPELDDEEMLAYVMMKFAKCFVTSFPEKAPNLKRLLDVMFLEEKAMLN